MALIEKLMTGIVTRGVNGERVLRPLAAAAVKSADGNTLEQHVLDVSLHTPVATLEATMDSKVLNSINVLKDGADGSSLAAKHDNLVKISTDIDAVRVLVEDFLTGAANGEPIDRLIELVTAIGDNAATIDTLLNDKISYRDIVNNLTAGGVGVPLAAEQGKVLKGLIDQLAADTAGAIEALHEHNNLALLEGITQSAVTGGLMFNGIDTGLKRAKFMTEAQVAALTEWPADLALDGMIMMEPAV